MREVEPDSKVSVIAISTIPSASDVRLAFEDLVLIQSADTKGAPEVTCGSSRQEANWAIVHEDRDGHVVKLILVIKHKVRVDNQVDAILTARPADLDEVFEVLALADYLDVEVAGPANDWDIVRHFASMRRRAKRPSIYA